MLQADYAKINKDYKGTRVVGNSHRIRTCMQLQRHSLVCVFLTDSKAHERPEDREPAPRAPRPEPRAYVAPEPTAFDAMRETLKAGVQVVSADQLFPTPPDVARQVIELAEIRPGMRILEPSAGTGNLIDQMIEHENVTAIEVNSALVERLRANYPAYDVRGADFLTCSGDLGTFDRIVMNPPFKNADDIKHIQHARHMLAPGGRLVAVCANGPRQREALQPIALEWIDLPAGSFADSGTNVNAAIVVLTRG